MKKPVEEFLYNDSWLREQILHPENQAFRFWKGEPNFTWMDDWAGPRNIGSLPKPDKKCLDRFTRTLPPEYFERMIFVFLHYVHLLKKIFPGIEKVLESFLYFEWFMHMDIEKPWYRDHFIHPIKVAYIGSHLLTRRIESEHFTFKNLKNKDNLEGSVLSHSKDLLKNSDGYLFQYIKELSIDWSEINEALLLKTYWIAALLHDIGYVFSFFLKIEEKLRDPFIMYNRRGGDSYEHFFRFWKETLIYYFIKHIKDNAKSKSPLKHKSYSQIFKEIIDKSHGAPGALNILFFIEEVNRRNRLSPQTFFIFNWAALAILCHNLDGFYSEYGEGIISFKNDPISFFLILADQINEWGRINISSESLQLWQRKDENELKNSKRIGTVMLFDSLCEGVKVELHKERGRTIFEMNYVLSQNCDKDFFNPHFKDDKKLYHDGKKRHLDPRGIFHKIDYQRKAK